MTKGKMVQKQTLSLGVKFLTEIPYDSTVEAAIGSPDKLLATEIAKKVQTIAQNSITCKLPFLEKSGRIRIAASQSRNLRLHWHISECSPLHHGSIDGETLHCTSRGGILQRRKKTFLRHTTKPMRSIALSATENIEKLRTRFGFPKHCATWVLR